jgi:LacI family transcriptional regulator
MPEKKASNIRDIARLAGVSVASVSRALRNEDGNGVSAELRKRILEICEKAQYYPNVHTVRMFSRRANTVAFLFPARMKNEETYETGAMDPNLAASIAGVEEELALDSIYTTLVSTSDSFIKKKEYLKLIRGKMVDGVILWGWSDKETYINELLEEKVPMVMIQCGGDFKVSQITAQDYEGMKELVKYVIELGHRNISIASPLKTSSAGRNRLSGIMDALSDAGLKPAYVSNKGDYGVEFGYNAGLEILKNAPETTCVIASNDYAALGVIKAAKEKGLSVPEDLSVTGADGVKIPGLWELTTYFSPSYQIGLEGAKILKDLIGKPKRKPVKISLPVKLIKGETTKELP